jgi:hypothetical protein
MKLKTLLLVVGLLAAASVIVYIVQRPAAPAEADARVGEPLLPATVAEPATAIRLVDAGATVELVRQSDGTWQVASYHDLPADFGKLSRFVKDLTEARIERVVTRSLEAIGRLGFGQTSLTLTRAGGEAPWSVDLGRTAEGGGRFVRFGDETKAYRARLSAWLDTTSRNWVDTTLVTFKPEQVAKVEVDFPAGSERALRLARGTAEEPFRAENEPDRLVRQSAVTSLLHTLGTLRFSDTTEAQHPDAIAARANLRRVQVTTFDGDTVTIALGRRPEQHPESAPADAAEAETEPAAEAGSSTTVEPAPVPAGPVFALMEGDPSLAKPAAKSDRVAFQVSEFVLSGLPKERSDWLEATPPAAPASPDAPASAAADEPPTGP